MANEFGSDFSGSGGNGSGYNFENMDELLNGKKKKQNPPDVLSPMTPNRAPLTPDFAPIAAPNVKNAALQDSGYTGLMDQATKTATEQMNGATKGFDEQAAITREALRLGQAQRQKQQREALLSQGLRDTGTYTDQLFNDPNQNLREQISTERDLGAAKGALQQTAIQTGLSAAQGITGQKAAAGEAEAGRSYDWASGGRQLAADIAKSQAGITSNEKIAGQNLAGDIWKTQATIGSNEKLSAADIASREKVTGMNIASAENLALVDRDTQTLLTNLRGVIDKDQLITGKTMDAAVASLDREQKKWEALGNWDNAKAVETLRGTIESQMQTQQQTWQSSENRIDNAWKTGERIDQNDFDNSMKLLDAKIQDAKDNNDFEKQKYLENSKQEHELTMQTNGFTQEESQTLLSSQIADAKANGDVDRQKLLMDYQSNIDINEMFAKNDNDVALTMLKGQIDQKIANGDHESAASLQRTALEHESIENDKNRAINEAELKMKQIGFNYDLLMQQVEAGQIAPESATNLVKQVMATAGIIVQAPDPYAASKAVNKKIADAKSTWLLTHPEFKQFDAKTASGESISPEGEKAFTEFYNNAMYGELTTADKEEKANAGYRPESEIGLAAAGDQFVVKNSVKAANGETIPPGKYSIVEESNKTGDWFSGEGTETKRFAINQQTGARVQIGTGQGTAKSGGFAGKVLDPLGIGAPGSSLSDYTNIFGG